VSDSSATNSENASPASDAGFCLRFGQLLDALNISQNEFARQLGSTSAFVSNMARGKSKPGLDFLQKIAETFDVSLDWLVLGKGTRRGEPFLDPDGHHAVLLRVTLAQLVAAGDPEARSLANELLSSSNVDNSSSPARQALLDELTERTRHGPLLAMLYNQFLSVPDAEQRGKDVLRMALQQLQPSSKDPLASMLQAAKPQATAPASAPAIHQVQIGKSPRMSGGNYYEK
jgi:transcriptional regulator with XRE-family HTH domain